MIKNEFKMSLIGSGSFGQVFEKDGKAIKILRDKGYKGTLCSIREIDVFSKIRDTDYCIQADVVQLHHNGNITFVMERGVADMAKVIRAKKVTDKMILHAALGLEFLHSRGMIHGDFKPSNVIAFDDGSAKIIDFGFTMKGPLVDIEEGLYPDVYQAPEIRRAANYSTAIDVWAFGVFLVQCKYVMCLNHYYMKEKALLKFLDTLTMKTLKEKNIPDDMCDVILGVLKVDPLERSRITEVTDYYAVRDKEFNIMVAEERLKPKPRSKTKSQLPELSSDIINIIENIKGLTDFVRNATIRLARRAVNKCDVSSDKKKFVFAMTCALIIGKYYSPIHNNPNLDYNILCPILDEVKKLEIYIVFKALKGLIVV